MQGDLLQMKVRKAIVLAAGHGTRLRPFTCATPKPLMPVWGEPMLGRIVAMLRSWGVDDIAFNTHCLHEQVKAWADGYRRGAAAAGDKVKIKVSYEPEILGTGGVLNPLREWIAGEPFYLVNGDVVVENAPNPLDKIRNFDSTAVIGVAHVNGLSRVPCPAARTIALRTFICNKTPCVSYRRLYHKSVAFRSPSQALSGRPSADAAS